MPSKSYSVMKFKTLLTTHLGILISLSLIQDQLHADVSIAAVEGNNGVTLTLSGSLNLDDFPASVSTLRSGRIVPNDSGIQFATSPGTEGLSGYAAVDSAPSSIGDGNTTASSTKSGDSFSVSKTLVAVPRNYQSDAPLSSTLTFSGHTFSSLGIAASGGPYVWSLLGGQTVTLSIQSSTGPGETTDPTVRSSTLRKLKKFKKKLNAAKKKGRKAKVKKLKRQIKTLKSRL